MSVDPLGLVPQGVADTGAAVVFGRSPEAANATNMLYRGAEQLKEKTKQQNKAKKEAFKVPSEIGWYPYQDKLNQGYGALVESLTQKKAQGVNIDSDPDSLKAMQKYTATVGATNTKKKEIEDLLDYTRKNQDKIENADEIYAYINETMTGNVPLKDLISNPTPTPVLKPEKEEPIDFYETLGSAFGDPNDYAKEVSIEDGMLTTDEIRPDKVRINSQAEFFVETPEGVKWTNEFYGGDKDKAKGAAKAWIENQVKTKYKESQDEGRGGAGANVTDDEIYDRNEKIYYLQNGLRFTDAADKEKSRQILGAIIGAKSTTGFTVSDAEFVQGKGNEGDVLLLTGKRKVGSIMKPDKQKIDLTDPASYGELNQLFNSNTSGNIKIPNEILQKRNAENPNTFTAPLKSDKSDYKENREFQKIAKGVQNNLSEDTEKFIGQKYRDKTISAITKYKSPFYNVGDKYETGDVLITFDDKSELVIPAKSYNAVYGFVKEVFGGGSDPKDKTPMEKGLDDPKDGEGIDLGQW